MTFSNKISIAALLCLTSNPAWSEQVNFCKVKKIYDNDINVPTKIVYEDCSGVAFFWYAKDFVKASCWEGATNLLEGKCDAHKDDATTEIPETEAREAENQD
jgi:hypothetical protein